MKFSKEEKETDEYEESKRINLLYFVPNKLNFGFAPCTTGFCCSFHLLRCTRVLQLRRRIESYDIFVDEHFNFLWWRCSKKT